MFQWAHSDHRWYTFQVEDVYIYENTVGDRYTGGRGTADKETGRLLSKVDVALCKESFCDKERIRVDTRELLTATEFDYLYAEIEKIRQKLIKQKEKHYNLVNQDNIVENLIKPQKKERFCSDCGELEHNILPSLKEYLLVGVFGTVIGLVLYAMELLP